MATPKAPRADGVFAVELSELAPKLGDVVSIVLRAEDSDGHLAHSDERLVLISPASVNVKAYACAAELKRAAQLAKRWSESLTKARDAVAAARAADPRNAKAAANLWPAANRALGATGETTVLLRQALLRALLRSDSPTLS